MGAKSFSHKLYQPQITKAIKGRENMWPNRLYVLTFTTHTSTGPVLVKYFNARGTILQVLVIQSINCYCMFRPFALLYWLYSIHKCSLNEKDNDPSELLLAPMATASPTIIHWMDYSNEWSIFLYTKPFKRRLLWVWLELLIKVYYMWGSMRNWVGFLKSVLAFFVVLWEGSSILRE